MTQTVTKEELSDPAWFEASKKFLFDPDVQRDMHWFAHADFPEEMEGQWVAIYDCQIVAHGQDIKALPRKASKITGVPENKISVQFVIPSKMTVI